MAWNSWSELPPELLENIAQKCLFRNLKELVMFSCVCCSWHRAAAIVKSAVVPQPHQIPWLMLPNDYSSKGKEGVDELPRDDKRTLFDLSNNMWYNLSHPETFKRKCYGTGCEWILTVGLDREFHLINPLTRVSLPLPSYLTFHHLPVDEELTEEEKAANEVRFRTHPNHFTVLESPWDDNEFFRNHTISRAIVLRPPQDLSKLIVVVIYTDQVFNYAAAAMPQDYKWTPIINPLNICDAAYCPTSGLLLFLRTSGHVMYCDLQHLNKSYTDALTSVDYVQPPPCFISEDPQECLDVEYDQLYLLESFGNILMVRRAYNQDYMTYYFDVHKLDLQTKEWDELLDLGDVALFVGNSPATSAKVSVLHPSCKPNSIYFNDDGLSYDHWGPEFDEKGKLIGFVPGGRDMGVYDFHNGTVKAFYPGNDYLSKYSVPIWFIPKI